MTGTKKLLEKICKEIEKKPDNAQAYYDLYGMARETLKTDESLGIEYIKRCSEAIEKQLSTPCELETMRKLFSLHKEVLLKLAPTDFDSYLLYLEWNRAPEKKFYVPRRKVLRSIVQDLQDLADDKLDLLAISMPPGTGKTSLAIFYLTWLAGREPNSPMLTGSHSNSFVRGVYDECLRIFDPNGEYLWHDVFPGINVSNTNAKDCRIDLDRRQRFETLEFTSIGTGNAGLYRAATLLYCDDLVSGLEVALSKERLDKLWDTYNTDLRQRKIGDKCKELHIATKWSVSDVIGRLEDVYGNSNRARFVSMSALDENDESNFDYAYGVGFSTQFYHEQRDIMDEMNWRALYMNAPIERNGLLYPEDSLRYYFDLPDGEPDAIISVCDTKDRGSDFASLPVAYQYGQNYYIEDVCFTNAAPEIVDVELVNILLKHKVQLSRFESNSAGGRVAKEVQEEIKRRGGITRITTKFTTANKETKILMASPFAKEHLLFKDPSMYKKNSEYGQFMKALTSHSLEAKMKHDDAPDSIAMLVELIQSMSVAKVTVFDRPW